MATKLVLAVLVLVQVYYAESACTIPDLLRDSHWQDNVKGNVSFTTWKMTGWTVQVGSDKVDEWEIVDNVNFASDGYLALRSATTFTLANTTTYYSYVCMKFEKITTEIYRYYTLHDQEPVADNNNVLIATHDGLTHFNEICNVAYSLDKKLFSVLVKDGRQPSMMCPNPILANFKYEVEVPGAVPPATTVVCSPEQTGWTGCTNKQQVELQNTSCSHPVAYSDSGKLNCIANYKDGTTTSVILMNTDATVDNDKTFRFACAMVKDDGSEMVISPRECFPDQTTVQLPHNRAGTVVGQRITASDVNTDCRIYPEDPDDDPLLSTPAIVGIVIGAVALIVIIIGIICCCCKMRD